MRTLFTLLLLISSTVFFAQEGREKKEERIRTYKVGFLTERLELNPKEAQQFWPIYNEFDKEMETLRRSKFEVFKSFRHNNENLTEAQLEEILTTFLEVEQKSSVYKMGLAKRLKSIMPVKKILALFKAEEDFKRRLLKQLRNRKGQRPRD